MWYIIGKYITDDPEEDYEEIFDVCHSFQHARDVGRDMAPWMGDEWAILIRHEDVLTGKECDVTY